MSPHFFVDTNILICAAGRPHPLKELCAQILLLAAERPSTFFTDAEVLQEFLHWYLALQPWPQGRDGLERCSTIMRKRIEPVYAADVEAVATLAGRYNPSGLSERDLLHAAVAMRVGPAEIVSADRGFGKFPEMKLLKPKDFDAWRPRPVA